MLMAPILEEFAKSNHEVFVGKINNSETDLMKRYEIVGIPQLILLENGVEERRNIGPLSSSELQQFVAVQHRPLND